MSPAVHTVKLFPLVPPGSKNVKTDTLFRCYSPKTTTSEPETILPTSCLATALSWGIGKQVHEAQHSQ